MKEPAYGRPAGLGAEGIAFMMHFGSNTGFAIEKLEQAFFEAAQRAGYASDDILFTYPSIESGKPRWMPDSFGNVIQYDWQLNDATGSQKFSEVCAEMNIRTAFVFDLQPSHSVNSTLRKSGVDRIIAYWGAAMSSRNRGLILQLKRLEVALRRKGPDTYVFESLAMKELATHGRGIPERACVVIPTGVDTDRFKPAPSDAHALASLDVPANRKVFVYTGHMEPRKGVHVIVQAMDLIVGEMGRDDIHFLALGNRPGEESRFFELLENTRTSDFMTFAGYHDAVEAVLAQSYAGVVASTGWDSWPMSVLEMGSSGLPLLVSDLQGLKEFVVDGVNGNRFPPGDFSALASLMVELADDETKARAMGRANREKVIESYSRSLQISRLASLLRNDR